MKNVVFIIRDGFDAKYIYSRIINLKKKYNITYILESGKKARKKKFVRMFKSRINVFHTFFNMCALVIFDKIMLKGMKKICISEECPSINESYHIEDVNDQECINICNGISPDLIIIYGTGILTAKTINCLTADIYNIHSSVLPYYRNVHSDFWAYMNEEYDKIGITIFKLNTGIDTGSIAKQMVCDMPANSKLFEYKAQNLKNIVDVIPIFLDEYFNNRITLQDQDSNSGSTSYTPGTKDIIKLLKREIKSR